MWHLFFILFGLAFCSDYETNVETLVGEDVNFECLGTSTANPIASIAWKKSDGTPLFHCKGSTCGKNTTIHSLGGKDTFISIVTIRNVSLIHEDEYSCAMVVLNDRRTCKINLTVIVPPIGLILVDKADATTLQNKGSLIIAEGGNKTIVCQTNTSVKPAVNLEWVTHEGINISRDSYDEVQDELDGRLYVSTRTLSFRPTYKSGKDVLLVCKVAANSSFDHLQTSIYITDKGESTTKSENLSSCCEEIPTLTTSNGDLKATESPYTTHLTSSSTESYYPNLLIITSASGVMILLLALAFVGGVICSKKTAVGCSIKAESPSGATETRPSKGQSKKGKDGDAEVSGEYEAVETSASFYMELKPIDRPKLVLSSPKISNPMASADVKSNYVSPTSTEKFAETKKFAETDQGLRKEHTYLNTESATREIVLGSESLDDVYTTCL